MPALGRATDPLWVCLMIVIVAQVGLLTTSTSSGCDEKLDPDERDTQAWLAKQGSDPPPADLIACVRLTPNSEKAFGASVVPLMPLLAALIWFALTAPLKFAPLI